MEIRLVDTALIGDKKYSASNESANAERRVRNALVRLKKVRTNLTIAFGIDILRDVKYVYDTAAVELVTLGETAIYWNLVETLNVAEQQIGNMSVVLRGVEIKGLSHILAVITDADYGHISRIDFGLTNAINCILEK